MGEQVENLVRDAFGKIPLRLLPNLFGRGRTAMLGRASAAPGRRKKNKAAAMINALAISEGISQRRRLVRIAGVSASPKLGCTIGVSFSSARIVGDGARPSSSFRRRSSRSTRRCAEALSPTAMSARRPICATRSSSGSMRSRASAIRRPSPDRIPRRRQRLAA